jgi:hypothetical protein
VTTPPYEPDDGPLTDADLQRLEAAADAKGSLRRVLSLALLEQIHAAMSAGDYAAVSRLRNADLGPYAEDDEPIGPDDLPRFREAQRPPACTAAPAAGMPQVPALLTPTALYVHELAQRLGVTYTPTYADHWAKSATKLEGDDVPGDATDDLLVALVRAGQMSNAEMIELVMAHHRELKLLAERK